MVDGLGRTESGMEGPGGWGFKEEENGAFSFYSLSSTQDSGFSFPLQISGVNRPSRWVKRVQVLIFLPCRDLYTTVGLDSFGCYSDG